MTETPQPITDEELDQWEETGPVLIGAVMNRQLLLVAEIRRLRDIIATVCPEQLDRLPEPNQENRNA